MVERTCVDIRFGLDVVVSHTEGTSITSLLAGASQAAQEAYTGRLNAARIVILQRCAQLFSSDAVLSPDNFLS